MSSRRSVVNILFAMFLCIALCSCANKTEQAVQQGLGTSGGKAVQGAGGQNVQKGQQQQIKEGVIGNEGIREPAGGNAVSEARTSAPFLPVYFDFDRYIIRPDMISRMERNAQAMLDNPEIKVEIQGNCDERGTNEYNLALGEKRAKAAKDYLVMMGVDPDRISIVSLGEEKPLDPGHNEAAWAKNRRDDFIIYK